MNKTVLVFKTSVTKRKEIRQLGPLLDQLINPNGRWNFDLEDRDKILRVEAYENMTQRVIELMNACNYACNELE